MPVDARSRSNLPPIAIALSALVLLLSGCQSYQLRGKVVSGAQSQIKIVSKDHPRLHQRGIEDVRITVTLDPQSLDNKQVASGHSSKQGSFSLPVEALGAGFLEHVVMVAAVKEQKKTAKRILQLPGRNKRLLIVLTDGRSTQPRHKGQALDEVLEESEPYMEQVK